MSTAPSPCRDICTLDGSKSWCTGCGRTLEEIANWPQASEAAKRLILEQLPERLLSMKAGGLANIN
jgi:uncharacterized protein